ncbi:uncharacterized protein ACA1_161760 [Acanthamoeba castellanii str. Neff]|uniref:Uncharacterized protein n=1 Tax=Acanthamoeba castellanii (strain ATCC 30010 / Neff) TaxID=1257118 RepID=L8H119_ACACF|nr:uncharacterized protein ACA1_161760 [Acanthamoeba castellanii str. Neff]ELR18051.1 hypothetical protein ACA1_161760 [Acanthamoeba castellanii str. Neff]
MAPSTSTATMTQAAPAKRRKIANGPAEDGGRRHQQQQRRHYDQIDNEEGGELELDLERELDILIRSPALYGAGGSLCLPLDQQPFFVDVNTNTNDPELFASSSSYSSPSLSPTIDSFTYSSSSSSPYLSPCTTSSPASPSSHTSTKPTTMSVFVPPPMAEDTATVTLTHKPRGSHGAWSPLNDGQRIRVTKGRGKRLRIVVKCRQRFDWPDVRLRLLDLTNGPALECADFYVCNDRSTLQDEEDGGSTAVIEFHVSRVRARMQFEVTLERRPTGHSCGSAPGGPCSCGWTWEGRTVSFVTHNNGKDRPPRGKRLRD